jgi:hypothetical protein
MDLTIRDSEPRCMSAVICKVLQSHFINVRILYIKCMSQGLSHNKIHNIIIKNWQNHNFCVFVWYPGPRGWWYLGPGLNKINRVLISIRCIFFFGSLSWKNVQVKHAWLWGIWDGWPTGKFSRVRTSEDEVRTKDSCWSVGTIYNPRELPRVSAAGPAVDWVLQFIQLKLLHCIFYYARATPLLMDWW